MTLRQTGRKSNFACLACGVAGAGVKAAIHAAAVWTMKPDTPTLRRGEGLAENFYAGWRVQSGAANVLHDENDSPPERLLQAVWRHQRLLRDRLQTGDGRAVRVLHPGFASAEGGPDFRGALVQIGGDAPRSGDVEVDLRASGWRAHGHDRNPNFQNVILHVVWEAEGQSARSQPPKTAPVILPLKNSLDAPLGELGLWLETESPAALPENQRGRCAQTLDEMTAAQMDELLLAAAQVRLRAKAAQFHARARHAGWEQALWEGLFRALGYKHNGWPMQHLAELRPHWTRGAEQVLALQARLLGVSGLLPADLSRASRSAAAYLRRLWDGWWREREEFSDCLLPNPVWKFHGLRPANHPARRLALAAHWLADKNFIPKIERWIANDFDGKAGSPLPADGAHGVTRPTSKKFFESLHEILQVKRDEFWSWHWTFRSARLKKPQPLLGRARVTDLAVNVILPWLWIRAQEGENEKIQREVERRYFAWPAAEDNAVLKLARQRLLGTASRRGLKTAATQQGLMQIVRDFCGHTNAICADCRFPELVVERRANRQSPQTPPAATPADLRTGCC